MGRRGAAVITTALGSQLDRTVMRTGHRTQAPPALGVETHDENLCLLIRDDGTGGADPTKGSGLIGLTDRVEALGGQM